MLKKQLSIKRLHSSISSLPKKNVVITLEANLWLSKVLKFLEREQLSLFSAISRRVLFSNVLIIKDSASHDNNFFLWFRDIWQFYCRQNSAEPQRVKSRDGQRACRRPYLHQLNDRCYICFSSTRYKQTSIDSVPQYPSRVSYPATVLKGGTSGRKTASNVSLGFVLYQNDRFFRTPSYNKQRWSSGRVLAGSVGGHGDALHHVELHFNPSVRQHSYSYRCFTTKSCSVRHTYFGCTFTLQLLTDNPCFYTKDCILIMLTESNFM